MINLIPANKYCTKVFDGTHDTPIPAEKGHPLITSKNIFGGRLNYDSVYNISEEEYVAIQRRSSVKKWDILFSMIGSIGETYLEKNDNIPYAIKNVGVFSCNDEYKAKWLYYYLISPYAKKFIENYLTGAVQKFLSLGTLRKFPIVQYNNSNKKIVDLLYDIDSKIEFNNKINTELEKIAKTIYNYWFVQFDFPDKNGDPYKTSGGKMVWNKELKKEIPDGWEDKKLKDILKKNNKRFNLNGDKYNIDTIDLSVMPSSTMCLTGKNTSDKFGTNLFEMSRFDILFGGIRPYLLKAGFAPFNGLVTGTVHSFKIIKDFNYNFALLTITHNNVFKFAVSNSKGTKMPVISSDDLLEYKFAYEENVVKKFNELISFKEIISKNITENHKLAELRDWLLPMLMNGQASIK